MKKNFENNVLTSIGSFAPLHCNAPKHFPTRRELDCIDSLCSLADMRVFVCQAATLTIGVLWEAAVIGQACGQAATTQFVPLNDVTHQWEYSSIPPQAQWFCWYSEIFLV